MSNFQPNWQITIDGTNVTGLTLSNLSISSGRQNIYEQAFAGYCNVTMINTNQAAIAFTINSTITISIKDLTNTFVPIFGGSIVDVGVSVATASQLGVT